MWKSAESIRPTRGGQSRDVLQTCPSRGMLTDRSHAPPDTRPSSSRPMKPTLTIHPRFMPTFSHQG